MVMLTIFRSDVKYQYALSVFRFISAGASTGAGEDSPVLKPLPAATWATSLLGCIYGMSQNGAATARAAREECLNQLVAEPS